MKNWTTKKRITLKSAVGALARRVRRLVPRSKRFPLPLKASATPTQPEFPANSREQPAPAPRKRARRETLAVEDGFKEF